MLAYDVHYQHALALAEQGALQVIKGKQVIGQCNISIACDGALCTSGGNDGTIYLWNLEENDFVRGPEKVKPIPPEPEEGIIMWR